MGKVSPILWKQRIFRIFFPAEINGDFCKKSMNSEKIHKFFFAHINHWWFWPKIQKFWKNVRFLVAEIIGDFCTKSMKSERKWKNIPRQIIGDFWQKSAKFEDFLFFCLQKSLVILGKNREILKKSVSFFLQKSLVISARNRWNRNENGKIFLEKSLGISNRNQRNLKIFYLFCHRKPLVIFAKNREIVDRFYHIKSESGTKTRRKRPTAKQTPVLRSHFVTIFGEFWPFLPYQIGIRH